MPSDNQATKVRSDELVAEIEEHVSWYDTRAWWMQRCYVFLVTIGSLGGFIATLLLNLDWVDTKSGWAHYIVTSLPALASLATFIAATFGIRDLRMLRETGTLTPGSFG